MKKLRFYLVSLFCVTALFGTVTSAAVADGSIALSEVNANPGEDVTLNLSLADNPGVAYLKFTFTYDTNKLSYVSNTKPNADFSEWQFNVSNPGEIIAIWIDSNGGNNTAEGAVLNLTFHVADTASGGIPVSVTLNEAWDENDDPVSFSVSSGKIVTSYTVTWKSQDGTVTYEEDTGLDSGTTPSFNGNEPLKNPDVGYSYEFAGWATETGQETGKTVSELDPVTDDVTYYAAFSKTARVYTVRFNSNDGTSGESEQQFTFGTAQQLAQSSFTRSGYGISGWNTVASPDDTNPGESYAADASLTFTEALVTEYLDKGYIDDETILNLYAQWEPITYNLEYDLAGGSVETENPLTYTIKSDPITLNNPEKENYTFIGWTGTGLTGVTMEVTIPTGSIENRSYTANYTPNITIADSAKQAATGVVSSNKTTAAEGTTVTLTVARASGYYEHYVSYSYTDGDGNEQTEFAVLSSGNTYAFGMPAYPVTVNALFVKYPELVSGDLTYNSMPQDLLVPGDANMGTMQYAFSHPSEEIIEPESQLDWAETVSQTNAGEYYGWVRVIDENGIAIFGPTMLEVSKTIGKASASVMVKEQTYTYSAAEQGENNAVYTTAADITAKVEVSGLQGSDALTSVKLNGLQTNAGEYPGAITAAEAKTGDDVDNYDFTYTAGKLTITKASAAVTVTDQSYTYSGSAQGENNAVYTSAADITRKVTVTGLKGSDALTSVKLNGQETNIGEYTGKIEASEAKTGDDVDNYNFTYTAGKLTIGKAQATITVIDQTYTYNAAAQGENNATYTSAAEIAAKVSVTGLLGSDTLTSITLNGTQVNAGEYTGAITASAPAVGSATNNYEFSYTAGKLTIGKAAATVTVTDQSYEYSGSEQGENNAVYTNSAEIGSKVTVSGLLGSDALTSVKLNGLQTNAGEYPGAITAAEAKTGDDIDNYNFTYTAGKLTITKASATVTVTDQRYTYSGSAQGENNATYTAAGEINGKVTITGLKGSDALTSVKLNGQETNIGEYPGKIEASEAKTGDDVDNYNFTYTAGKLTIGKAQATITVIDQTYTYNAAAQGENNATYTSAADITAKVSVTGLLGSDTLTSITLNGTQVNAGEYNGAITASAPSVGSATDNYEFEYTAGKLTIGKAAATVTVMDQTYEYSGSEQGENNATFTNAAEIAAKVSVTGLLGSDALTSVTLNGLQTNAGEYPGAITAAESKTGDDVDNYNFTYTAGKLTITKVSATVTVTEQSYTYNGSAQGENNAVYTSAADITGKVSVTGLKGSDALTSVKLNGQETNIGEYPGKIEASEAKTGDNVDNYNFTYTAGKLTIGKAQATITVIDQTYTYNAAAQGENNATYTSAADITAKVSVTGLLGSDTLTSITLNGTQVNADEYTGAITASAPAVGNATNNYEFSYTAGKLTIEKAQAAITVTDQTYEYSGSEQGENNATYTSAADIAAKVSVTGLLGTDALTSITLNGLQTNAGEYTGAITAAEAKTGDNADNYDFTYTAGKLTITKVSATVTVTDQSYEYSGSEQGENNAVYTSSADINGKVTVTGLKGSDTLTSVTLNGLQTNAGEYPGAITAAEAKTGDDVDNYNFTYTAGKLTITKVSATVTVTDQRYTYSGSAQGENNAVYTSAADITGKVSVTGLKGNDALTSVKLNGQETTIGEYPGKIEASEAKTGEGVDNYNFTYTAGKLTIGKALVTITVIDQTYTYNTAAQGENNATYTDAADIAAKVSVTGLLGSDTLTSITLNGTQVNAGEYTGAITASAPAIGSATNNYEFEYAAGKLTIGKAAATVTVTDQSYEYSGSEQGENNATFTNAAEIAAKVSVTGLLGSDALTSVTLNGLQTNAGEYPGAITAAEAKTGDDVDNYDFTYTAGKLTITKVSATVTVIDQSYTYNGSAQGENNAVYTSAADISRKVSVTGLKGSDALTSVKLNGQQSYVGEYADAITAAEAKTGEGVDNYNFTYVPGKLTISERSEKYQVTVVSKGITDPITYDGQAHTLEGFETLSFEIEGNTYTVSGLTASVTGTDAGSYTNAISGTAVVTDANDNDVTAQFTVSLEEGTMKITAREITVSVEDKSVDYTGEEQSGNSEYTFTNLAEGHAAVISYTPAKGTTVGIYEGSFGDDLAVTDAASVDVTKNYSLYEKTAGKLSIFDVPVNVKVIPGANMTKTEASGMEDQTVNLGSAISAVVYTAGADYYFPADYAVEPVNGISVTRDSDTQVTVSGMPTADTKITLKDPSTRASNTVADPKITPEEGTYTEQQTITITGETEGAVIWYTTDGSDPSDPASNRKQYTGEFVITETSTIRAYAEKDGMFPSKVFTHVITIELPPEPWEINVDIHNFTNTGAKGVPGDVPRTEITLTIQIVEKESGEVVSTASGVKFDVMGGPNSAKLSLENVEFDRKVEDLSEAKYKAVVKVSPSKVSGVAPMNQVYTLTNEAWPGGRELITIYLKWDDGKRSEPERIKVYALPEDEVGAYTILKDGTKEYLIFHTYDICMQWLGSDELCRGYERCFHKESPYENPFVTATGVIGEIVN